jgi:hypothetical protein
MRRIETDDTAGAVRMIQEESPGAAAIDGSPPVWTAVLAKISAPTRNYTAIIIARGASRRKQTSIVIRQKHARQPLPVPEVLCRPGRKPLKIESRPIVVTLVLFLPGLRARPGRPAPSLP